MKKIYIILLFITIIIVNDLRGGGFRRPFQLGDYYEFEFRNYDGYVQRYYGRVILDSLSGSRYYSKVGVYNEPPFNYREYKYIYDTISRNVYGYSVAYCPDTNGNYLEGGFNLNIGFFWNTCHDTTGGIYFKSIISDTGTYTGTLNSGIPLKAFNRTDTIGAPIDNYETYVFSELFGSIYFYSDIGSPFGPGWYSKELKGAIIDGITYGSITLGITQTSNEIPEGFTLEQNYPNPFNPSTKIKFSIPVKDKVKLIVLDQLGRTIYNLVDEELSPGTYEYDFRSNSLSSGVYYYRLEAGQFVETRRMVLVK